VVGVGGRQVPRRRRQEFGDGVLVGAVVEHRTYAVGAPVDRGRSWRRMLVAAWSGVCAGTLLYEAASRTVRPPA
jgi:hypothetical protein